MIPIAVDFVSVCGVVTAIINTTNIFAATIDASIVVIIGDGETMATFVVVFAVVAVVANYNSTSFYTNA